MNKQIIHNLFFLLITLTILFFSLPNPLPAQSPDWPCFYGPERNSISKETGLVESWPESGPELIRTIEGCGKGYSAVAVTGDRIYVAGNFDRRTYVMALDPDGNQVWKTANMASEEPLPVIEDWPKQFFGVKSTPTVDRGMVFHLNETGRLAAYYSENGREIWAVDIGKEFDGKPSPCGYSESVLVDGDLVFCQPGGIQGFLAALDRKTGRTVWTNTDFRDSVASYVSPILVEDKGIRQLITLTPYHAVSVDPASGKTLWRIPHANKDKENIDSPVYWNGLVGVSSSYGKGFDGIRLSFSGNTVTAEKVWTSRKADNLHGGLVILDGFVYGSACIGGRWFCLNMTTGEEKYFESGLGLGSQVYADGHFYCLSQKGHLGLVKAASESFEIISQVQLPDDGQGPWFTHPVVTGGRLYIRHGDFLYVYDVKEG